MSLSGANLLEVVVGVLWSWMGRRIPGTRSIAPLIVNLPLIIGFCFTCVIICSDNRNEVFRSLVRNSARAVCDLFFGDVLCVIIIQVIHTR